MDEIALLSELDRELAEPDPSARAAAQTALQAKISADHIPARRVRSTARPTWSLPRSWRLVVAAAMAVAAVLVGGPVSRLARHEAAYAATPMLLVSADGSGLPARPVLQRLADAAATQPVPGHGPYQYLKTNSWYLHTAVGDGTVNSAVVPLITERWIGDDRSAVVIEGYGDPIEAGPPGEDGDKDAVEALPDGASKTTHYGPGEWSPDATASLPHDPAELRDTLLQQENPEVPDHIELFVAFQEILPSQRMEPDLLAAFYDMLADEQPLRFYGPVTDRAGRRGIAIGFDSDYGGLPGRDLLIVDRQTGTPLGIEEILTKDPGALNVRVPAVIGYEAFLAGGRVRTTESAGPSIP